jgi:hypothetical protein
MTPRETSSTAPKLDPVAIHVSVSIDLCIETDAVGKLAPDGRVLVSQADVDRLIATC